MTTSAANAVQPDTVYACVHAPEFALQAMLRLRHGLRGRPVSVLEGHPPLERVCAANTYARRAGIADGMTRVEAESFAGMVLLRRSLREEAEARAVLLACAAKYTPSIEDASSSTSTLCVLDLSGTEKLFGAPVAVAERLTRELAGLGMRVSIALSANFHAAVARARSGAGITSIQPGEEQQALAPLLLSVLPLSAEQQETLELWGIRTLGGLATLPERALVARMGQAGKRLRLLARGEHPHLFQPATPSFELRESYEFDAPVSVMDSLLFVLAPMLDQLVLRATERALSLASLSLLLRLDGNPELDKSRETAAGRDTSFGRRSATGRQPAVDAEPAVGRDSANREHCRCVRPALPTTDRKLLLKLLQLDLDAHPPGAAVLSLELCAEPGEASKVQMGLFSPPLPESSRLDVTLARLRALVGEACVGSPRLMDTYAPDSFQVQGFAITRARGYASHGAPAMRRVRPPAQLAMRLADAAPDGFWLGACQYQVVQAFGPWRASGSWWSSSVWSREQWELIAVSPSSVREKGPGEQQLCCLIAHDLLSKQWVLEAIFD